MPRRDSIVILDGGRRTPRADILESNRAPGIFSRFSTTQLGGMAIAATLQNTGRGRSREEIKKRLRGLGYIS
jgi:hypothetical protein